ncbi:MAG TPA: serine hydrolase domain-containing protein [Saprospiraceae bacterium]|nr:serine hydrolase domain-containing protein [Saprospiraceae bacterium]
MSKSFQLDTRGYTPRRNIMPFLHFVLLWGAMLHSQQSSPERLIEQFMSEGSVPGLYVAVIKGDSIYYQQAMGFADLEKHKPMTAQTAMEFGSLSKLFTAEIILRLHFQKRIQLDDPVRKYFDGAPECWSDMSINDLLQHTSGLKNYLQDPRFQAARYFQPSTDATEDANAWKGLTSDSMLSLFYSLPCEFPAGQGWAYSNSGYYLLGKIIERATGETYFDHVRKNLLLPMGMNQCMSNDDAAAKGVLATGYIPTDSGMKASRVLTGDYALSAGGWAVTGEDMIRLLIAMNQLKLPSDAAGYDWMKEMKHHELPFDYHGGRFFSQYKNKSIVSHNGGTPGFSSSWLHLPDEKISCILLINRQDYAAIDQLAWDLLAFYVPELNYPAGRIHTSEAKQAEDMLKQWIGYFRNREIMPDGCTPALKSFLTSENGKGLFEWFLSRGDPSEIHCVEVEVTGSHMRFHFRLYARHGVEYRMTAVVNADHEWVQLLHW